MKRRYAALLMAALLAAGTGLTGCGQEEDRSAQDVQGYSDNVAAQENGAADASEEDGTEAEFQAGQAGSDQPGWTMLLYLCGSDLESQGAMASMNIEEMCSASVPDYVNVIVETGGSSEWNWEGIDADELGRYELRDGSLNEVGSAESASMGDPSTLADFISWGVSQYPSEHYGLILWDHGGGNAEGVCYDELYENDNLTLEELEAALGSASCTFDFIGFDACLMASLETAKAVDGAGYYLVASEETEPGEGWDYAAILNALDENSALKGDELGKVICDSFLEKCIRLDCEDEATLSVVNLSKISMLDSAFDDYTGGMALAAGDVRTLNDVAGAADRTESYGGNTESEGYCNMVDMADLVENTQYSVQSDGTELLSAVEDAVVYETHGQSRENSNGLSVFYPISVTEEELSGYVQNSDNTPYLQYIAAVTDNYDSVDWTEAWSAYQSAGQDAEATEGDAEGTGDELQSQLSDLVPVTGSDFDIQYEQSLDEDGFLNLFITSGLDAVKSVHFLLWYETDGSEDGAASEFVYLGEDNDIEADWESGQFRDNFRGTWMTVGGEPVNAELIEETDNYNLYSIPAEVNGEETNLRAVYDFTEEAYRVLGTYDGLEEGGDSMTSRGIHPLEEGDEVVFLLPTYEADTDEEIWYYTDAVTWSDDVVMEDEDLGDGFFLYMYEIEDLFGTEYDTDPVEMQVDGDTIIPYES